MLKFTMRETARGLQVRQLLRQPKGLRVIVKGCLFQAMSEYASGKLAAASILDRFGRGGLARYGGRHRSAGYVTRQTRDLNLRGPAAFVSPRNVPAAKIANALRAVASAKGAPGILLAASRALTANPNRPHLRDLITRPGVGHHIIAAGNATVRVTMTFPAARALNANPQYADELRDLSKAGYRDWRAILARTRQLFNQAIADIAAGRQALADLRGQMLMGAA